MENGLSTIDSMLEIDSLDISLSKFLDVLQGYFQTPIARPNALELCSQLFAQTRNTPFDTLSIDQLMALYENQQKCTNQKNPVRDYDQETALLIQAAIRTSYRLKGTKTAKQFFKEQLNFKGSLLNAAGGFSSLVAATDYRLLDIDPSICKYNLGAATVNYVLYKIQQFLDLAPGYEVAIEKGDTDGAIKALNKWLSSEPRLTVSKQKAGLTQVMTEYRNPKYPDGFADTTFKAMFDYYFRNCPDKASWLDRSRDEYFQPWRIPGMMQHLTQSELKALAADAFQDSLRLLRLMAEMEWSII